MKIYTSNSRIETDTRCPRERYYGTEYAGTGLSPAHEAKELSFGTVIHQADEDLTISSEEAAKQAGERMKEAVKENMIQEPYRLEFPIMAEALTFAYRHFVLPTLLEQFDVVSTERAVEFVDKSGVVWVVIPDRLFLHKKTGEIWYQEKKTSGLDPQTFSRIWERKSQLNIGAAAVEQTLGQHVEAVIVQGFSKGSKYKDASRSRLVGGYRREGVPGVTKPTYKLDHAKGFEWFLASEYPGGVIEWVRQLPREVIAEAFPSTAPITPNPKLLKHYIQQRAPRELRIQQWREEVEYLETIEEVEASIDEVFPQNFDACENPITKHKCQFYEVCWNSTVGRDPLASGLFKLREGSPVTQKMIQLREVRDEVDA